MNAPDKKTRLAKPKSIWAKNVSIDLKALFVALGKGAAHVASLKADELGTDAVDLVASIGLSESLEELSYALIHRSLVQAIFALTKESMTHLSADAETIASLSETLASNLTNVEIKLDKDFFNKPGSQPFLGPIIGAFSQWLCDAGVGPNPAQAIASRVPAYFVFALSNEWKSNPNQYKPLFDQPQTPFATAESTERGWQHYFAHLKQKVSLSIFDEPFSLEQIYVPLNAYYTIRHSQPNEADLTFRGEMERVCIKLDQELKSWLRNSDRSDAVRVLSGGPGSGKSSFTKMFCCELATEGRFRPLYIPLHLIDPTRDVSQEVERFVRDEGLLGFNPLDPERAAPGLVLVFDGLDELASMGKAATQVARDFVQAVERMVERRNLGPNPINVLLSGRELIVQVNETEFRKPRQILTILPYWIAEDEQRKEYSDPSSLLNQDLRDVWWKKYGELVGTQFDGVPTTLRLPEIDEITAQPLLNYLVALSFRRGRLDFSKGINLNSVYADLVAAVHERAYEKSRTYRPISHLSLTEFIRVLEEIGLAAWHGSDGRSTSVRDIMTHCEQSGLQNLLKSFTEGAEAGVTKLLAAFFFRRNGENVGGDAAFVFTHKSFGEYLTAARLTRGLDKLITQRQRRIQDPDDGLDINEALSSWLKLAGPAPMTEYLKIFLQREIAQKPNETILIWRQILAELMSAAIEKHMPVERAGTLPFGIAVQYDINASCALMIALNACAVKLKEATSLKFSNDIAFGSFLRRVCPQRSGPESPLLYSALSYLDFSEQCLDLADLYNANLEHTIWNGCQVHLAHFGRANLEGARFKDTRLDWTRFDTARLVNVEFVQCHAQYVSFDSARILDAIFAETVLRSADFAGSTIQNSKFEQCDFSRTNIHEVGVVKSVKMSGVKLDERDTDLANWLDGHIAADRIEGNYKISSRRQQRRDKAPARAKPK